MKNAIIITGGDPAGISPELIEKIVPEIADSGYPVIYFSNASSEHLNKLVWLSKEFKLNHSVCSSKEILGVRNISDFAARFTIVDLYNEHYPGNRISAGQPDEVSGSLSLIALKSGCEFIQKWGCRGLLTAPLSKEWVVRSGEPNFSGHTGYLADYFKSDVLMLMHGKKFSVIPVTTHIPLDQVPKKLSEILPSEHFLKLLLKLGKISLFRNASWAMCGINPHAGEGGYIGDDEIRYINQVVSDWKKKDLPVEGPFPADALFMKENLSGYRLILGCYHDQVLIPFKAIEGRDGINCTIGLPFMRSSPDHGTAYSIAGKNRAGSESMLEAFRILVRGDLL